MFPKVIRSQKAVGARTKPRAEAKVEIRDGCRDGCGDTRPKYIDIHRKTQGNHRKTIGKPKENHRKLVVEWDFTIVIYSYGWKPLDLGWLIP